jgi:hypothetical protein
LSGADAQALFNIWLLIFVSLEPISKLAFEEKLRNFGWIGS